MTPVTERIRFISPPVESIVIATDLDRHDDDHVRSSAQQLSGRIIDAAVPTDSRQQAAIDRIVSSVREAIEPTVRGYADEIVQTATAELRREADLVTAD